MRVRNLFYLLGVCSILLITAPLHASPPDPTHCTMDRILVGNSSGAGLGAGYRVEVRSSGNYPMPGVSVALRFGGSAARPDQEQESGSTVDCSQLTVTRVTGPDGTVFFHPRVAGFDDAGLVQVRANGMLLGTVPVRSTDLDGDGVTDIRDLNLFRQRFLFDRSAPETDFDQNGTTNGFDLDRLRDEILLRARATPCP